MPHYEFFCRACKKSFSKILSLVDYEEGEVLCPHCGSREVEQRWSAFSTILPRRARDGTRKEAHMRFDHFSFGTIRIDGSTCEHDVVIDRGEVRKRKKGPSKQFSDASGHTPLSIEEKIPWKCRQLIIGTGAYGRLPVMKEVKLEAERRKVELVVLPTSQAIAVLNKNPEATNAILHVTC
jgi:putative FmdB family regulatory protein